MAFEGATIPVAKPLIGAEERQAVDRVMSSGMVAQGPEVAAFEQEFSDVLVPGVHSVAVNSGTSALHLGLLAAGIGAGDEVIVPAFTFAATANSVALTGATPVFADIDPATFCLDPAAAAAAVTANTRAIMPVHLYGQAADMTAFSRLAAEKGLLILEDAAQAHASTWEGRRVGTFGSFAAFSLYPTKNMTSGEGGMVTTGDEELARSIRVLRNQGMEKQYRNEVVGLNNRMTDIHAAIGRVQLTKVLDWTARRQANAAVLDEALSSVHGVATPVVDSRAGHVYHQYTIRLDGASTEDRDSFVAALRDEHGVGAGVYYPVPVNRLDSFAVEADLPHTERAAREVVSLPVHPSLEAVDLERIATAVAVVASAGVTA
ncbi:DegT/DnrJ/EryC1/StrS family aminotransferase [Citricoccus sp. SGAir0253]|uniref:DegT/DnrJ/EryC1/StrS family aminotransferase n=1 Tax=Citricoccus sp. SGAir0253 TaxID=2567881 RepID=UPI0010CCC195|nr:DegT/DnrJ/EryC1/StrS family aminotransferase [Citricoccus sp. SGAir0253]QCU79300.1 DegT/DnrJ/EryC1/StrS family aminotransferase [Citricoccus sp. SGAir0253]